MLCQILPNFDCTVSQCAKQQKLGLHFPERLVVPSGPLHPETRDNIIFTQSAF